MKTEKGKRKSTLNEVKLKPMTVAELKVVRVNEFGAFLDAGTGNTSDDILLHKAQQTAEVKVGEFVKVFLYLDPKKRLTAGMRVPKMRVGQIARLKVINVTGDGAFVDAGAERGIFMPF
ncbi:MAG: RNA-binding protein, partial [Selenomonadaceae bacterium]|nr:RNA-binding protein [Selenomonadaceae bacterium]